MAGVVGTSLVAYAKYRSVLGSIHRENVTAAMLGHRPPFTAGLNILVIGSDSRAGLGSKFGADVLGARSDTSMLLHIAPGHTRADIISFPRDSMVPILSCSNDGLGHTGPDRPGRPVRTAERHVLRPAARPACGKPWSRPPASASSTSWK